LTHRVNNTNLIHLLLDKKNYVNLEYVLQQGMFNTTLLDLYCNGEYQKFFLELNIHYNKSNQIKFLCISGLVLRYLIFSELGVLSVNEKNAKGLRPLHVACQITRPDCKAVDLLLQHGAEIDAADDDGRTALVHAMITHSDAFETLVRSIKN
jgi:ankyrin repeat protein